tara:strand:- start:143 stop:1075 length:933 start_codon:yes stop_codon:yes gene_type:complete
MFHHFHDDKFHKKSQGSITKDDFYKIIKFIGRRKILNAEKFQEKLLEKKLKEDDVCITFDDSVKSQIDVALPVLEDLKIKSFFFIYSSIFDKQPDNLEIFRYFRTNYFENIDMFYKLFFNFLNEDLSIFFKKNENIIKEKKLKFPHYSISDIKFRLVRDKYLDKNRYEKTMIAIMKEKNFYPKKIYSKLFFSKKDLANLNSLGHTIGLHSHSHPTRLENLSYEEQRKEYKKNSQILSEVLNVSDTFIKSMSHPCGSYNSDTLKILKEMKIEIGFKQIMKIEKGRGMEKINNSNFEVARQDHAEIMRVLNK